jgi:deazaflavin-dependent oxidoreductase (nitroreductase family)
LRQEFGEIEVWRQERSSRRSAVGSIGVTDPTFPVAERVRYNRDVRSRKYRMVTTLERASNRLIRLALRAGLAPRAFALLETTGRRTGLARHTLVGNGLDGDTFWLVAAHGTQADYAHNLRAEPRVRVKVGGVWRGGTAVVLPGDDPLARSRTLPSGRHARRHAGDTMIVIVGDAEGNSYAAADRGSELRARRPGWWRPDAARRPAVYLYPFG